MKKFERFLVPMIMVGILALSGCEPAPGTAAYNSMLRRPPATQVTGGPTSSPTSAPTPGSSFQPGDKIPADKAVVYVYHSGGSNHFFILQANGKNVAGLKKKGQYYAYVTEPGMIEFTAQTKGTCSITLDTKAGQTYYLKGSVPPGFAPTPSLVLVSPEVGANEIANCKLTTTILGSTSGPISSPTSVPTVATNGFHKVQGFGHFGPIPLQTCIPVYAGEPPQNYPYKDLGPVKGEYKKQIMEGSHASITKALENIADNAKAMNANAVIKTQPHMDFFGNYSIDGEAVVFDVMPKE